ncbi:MAG: signal recognition particle protein, partial [Alphaproteobacteria bacterium]|nr:signal recognition particle protein [Alphaproteobacteria bacterium]
VTGKPIKLLGTGEKWDALEPFHPDRMAGRILGMGDIVSLVEKATENFDAEESAKMAAKFKKGKFDFNDLLSQMRQMKKMGGAGALMKMLPGLGKMAAALDEADIDNTILKKQEAIILSMTLAERAKPDLLNARRKQRIAAGSGTSVQDINKLVKQQKQMETVMKRMKKMGMGNMMGMMKNMMGGGAEADLMMQALDADSLAENMVAAERAADPLGPNPFLQSSPGGLGPNPFGDMPGLAGLGGFSHGGKKKDRKKGKRR